MPKLPSKSKPRLPKRSDRIKAAIKAAIKRDGRCLACGTREHLCGAHMLVRNVAFPRYHADDAACIITLCSPCHLSYDEDHTPAGKIAWLKDKRMFYWAQHLKWLVGGDVVR